MSRVISLFAGCGGSSLGYKLAGCTVLAAVERDKNASAVYRLNFPDTRLYTEDICTLEPEQILAELGLKPGELDILDGSPPCQGFSMTGKRQLADPRNRLFSDYVRFLRILQPRAFVMENVPGLVAGQMRYIFREMTEQLTQAGYVVQARILNAMHYGVPQSRKRLIVLGFHKDLGLCPAHPLPQSVPISFRSAVLGLKAHDLICKPVGRALKLSYALKPGESGARLHQRYEQKGNDFSLIRLAWDKPSPTVCKTIRPGQCGLLHPDESRFLSIGELKRICAFPDDFQLLGTFEERWGRLGNAVPPLLTQAVANSLRANMRGT